MQDAPPPISCQRVDPGRGVEATQAGLHRHNAGDASSTARRSSRPHKGRPDPGDAQYAVRPVHSAAGTHHDGDRRCRGAEDEVRVSSRTIIDDTWTDRGSARKTDRGPDGRRGPERPLRHGPVPEGARRRITQTPMGVQRTASSSVPPDTLADLPFGLYIICAGSARRLTAGSPTRCTHQRCCPQKSSHLWKLLRQRTAERIQCMLAQQGLRWLLCSSLISQAMTAAPQWTSAAGWRPLSRRKLRHRRAAARHGAQRHGVWPHGRTVLPILQHNLDLSAQLQTAGPRCSIP